MTGVATFGVGDYISQKQSGQDYSIGNAASIATLGFITNGWILPMWFKQLDRIFSKSMVDRRVILAKIIADQVVYAPFAVSLFVFCQAEVCRVPRAREMSRRDQINIWLADCAVWPIINIINFGIVSLRFRPHFVAIAQLCWQTFISSVCRDPTFVATSKE